MHHIIHKVHRAVISLALSELNTVFAFEFAEQDQPESNKTQDLSVSVIIDCTFIHIQIVNKKNI